MILSQIFSKMKDLVEVKVGGGHQLYSSSMGGNVSKSIVYAVVHNLLVGVHFSKSEAALSSRLLLDEDSLPTAETISS